MENGFCGRETQTRKHFQRKNIARNLRIISLSGDGNATFRA
jgi:hypothetical protein